MDKNRDYKIALVIYTSSLDYDDRIRKELVSIKKLYPNVQFKIFALYYKNVAEEGVTSYGVPYKVYSLKSREKYPSDTHLLNKSWEFYKIVKPELKEFDAVWCADFHVFLFALLLHGKPMLWDLHELPMAIMYRWWGRALFRFIERKMRVIIHANEPRRAHMESLGMIKHPEKHYVLRNYPDFNEIDSEYDETYNKFVEWLGHNKCVYLQGIQGKDRADIESTSAVLDVEGLKLVVIGRTNDSLKEMLVSKYGKKEIDERVFFTGMIKQLKTPQYIRKCIMSLVFYKKTEMNNWFCEPNRLFQNVINGNPVVVGNNPPLKELVDEYGVGVCADTDGSDQEKITKAIREVLEKQDALKKNLAAAEGNWLWGSQETVISDFMNVYLK